jgi:hypothetical protein
MSCNVTVTSINAANYTVLEQIFTVRFIEVKKRIDLKTIYNESSAILGWIIRVKYRT